MNKREQTKYIRQVSRPISSERIVERSEKSKQFFYKSITAFRIIGGIVALVLAAAMLGGLIYAIVMFFRADWVQAIIANLK